MKVYAIVAVWGNTKNNHAGMYYLAKQLKRNFGKDFFLIPTPTKGSRFLFPLYRLYNCLIALFLRLRVKRNDVVFLMEYLLSETEQADIARILKNKCNVRGLAHLVPKRLEKGYSKEQLIKRVNYLDKLYVLGNSLKDYLVQIGICENKIITTFHYVDTEYYIPKCVTVNKPLSVICIGNMERDYTFLLRIIKNHPDIKFNICKGKSSLAKDFENLNNVELFGFMKESDMRDLMQKCDISLNVMKDTIGSNVITTSLACGLVILASKVGSIEDYIENGVSGLLFNSEHECSEFLENLKKSRNDLHILKNNAVLRSKELSLPVFIKWFKKEFYVS